jgi:hypothetical protein
LSVQRNGAIYDDRMDSTTTRWLPFLVIVQALVFWGWCLVDFTHTDERDMRTFTRPAWLVILTLGSVVGGLLWFSVGRPQGPARS